MIQAGQLAEFLLTIYWDLETSFSTLPCQDIYIYRGLLQYISEAYLSQEW